MRSAPSTTREWSIVAGAWLVVALVAVVWAAIDRHPPEWDHANHLERVVECAHDLEARDWRTILERSSFYPPLVPCAASLIYRLAPSDVVGAHLVLLAFLALAMAAIYLLGRRLANGAAGVAAAVVFASAPFVVFSTLRFQLDLPLAALVALTLYTASRTDGFTRVGWSLVTGVVAGIGLFTKPPFPVYVAPPLAYLALRTWTRRAAVNAALTTVIAVLVSLPWYGPRLVALPLQIGNRSYKQAAEAGQVDPFTWAGLGLYPRWSVTQFGTLAVVLLCVGVVVALLRRQWFALVALVVPFAVFELIQNKNLRYTLPILPIAAVVVGLVFAELGRRARVVGAIALAIAGVVQIGGTAFGIPPARVVPWFGTPSVMASSPSAADWKQRDMLGLISRHSRGARVTVSVVPNDEFFSVSNFRYYAVRDGLPLTFTRAWDSPLGIDYMILKTGSQGPSWTADKPRRILARFASDANLARVFPVIGEFPLPDGSVGTVRARSIPPIEDVRPAMLAEAIEGALRHEVADYARDVERLAIGLDFDDAIQRGHIRRLQFTADAATLGELTRKNVATLRAHDLRVVVDDVLVDPWSARAGKLEVLDAGRVLFAGARIEPDDLRRFVQGVKGFKETSLSLGDGAIAIAIHGHGPSVSGRLRILPGIDGPFALAADHVRYAGVPVPPVLVNWIVRNYDPAPRIASRLPVRVELGRVTITDQALRIEAGQTVTR